MRVDRTVQAGVRVDRTVQAGVRIGRTVHEGPRGRVPRRCTNEPCTRMARDYPTHEDESRDCDRL
ncbi:hypothetical protein ABZ820_36090 [Streptomyces diacarni]|uniref:hypothetical protein n=1 Tax=Streptomyces diacarni TaxID=2800381 RepID=UPI0033D71FCA